MSELVFDKNYKQRNESAIFIQCSGTSFYKDEMQGILDQYYKQMEKTVTLKEKLMTIATTIEIMERLHPFRDGNTRTVVFGCLNKFLHDVGFPYCIPDDPLFFSTICFYIYCKSNAKFSKYR